MKFNEGRPPLEALQAIYSIQKTMEAAVNSTHKSTMPSLHHCFYRFDKSYMDHSPEKGKYNAFIASPNTVCDPYWYFDSGASNHVTHDFERFQDISEHDGKNTLMVGNGEKLRIFASGTAD